MEETGGFSRLVSELNLEERNKLLEKLTGQSSVSAEPLYQDSQETQTFDPAEDYIKLPWYYKAVYFILSIFTSRNPEQIFEDHSVARQFRIIEEKAPGFYNYQKDLLLPKFQEKLIRLKESSRFFYEILDASLNRDRGALMIFLGSLEMPDIHRLIEERTDPASLYESYGDLSEIEIRNKAVKAMEETFMEITETERSKMYFSARSLYCLKQLSSFLFDRLINSFIHDPSGQGYVCQARAVKDQLAGLNNILYSLREPPPISLLESLFIFVLSDKTDEHGFDIEAHTRRLLSQAENSLLAIRTFNKEVPLTLMLQCISRNSDTCPKSIGGGEDWFAIYKDRWKSQIEEQYLTYAKTRRQTELQNSFRYFFRGTNLKLLDNMNSDQNPAGLEIKGTYALSFLQTFYAVVFMGEINKILRPILIDGDFIKKENKTEFTEYYNNLIKMEDLIKRFDRSISPEGDFGKRYSQVKGDMTALPMKRRKLQIIIEEAEREADKIIIQTKEAMQGMIKILGGIMNKSIDNKYDSLTNLAGLNGRGTAFSDGIIESIARFKKSIQILDDIDVLESAK